MAKIHAAEEFVKSVLLTLGESKLTDCSLHLDDIFLIFELELLPLLESKTSETEFILSKCASLVAEDVLYLA